MQSTSNVYTICNYNATNKQHTYNVTINLPLKCNINNICHSHTIIKLEVLHLQITIYIQNQVL
jgi:hypothetical protein